MHWDCIDWDHYRDRFQSIYQHSQIVLVAATTRPYWDGIGSLVKGHTIGGLARYWFSCISYFIVGRCISWSVLYVSLRVYLRYRGNAVTISSRSCLGIQTGRAFVRVYELYNGNLLLDWCQVVWYRGNSSEIGGYWVWSGQKYLLIDTRTRGHSPRGYRRHRLCDRRAIYCHWGIGGGNRS